jgi:hypothetical protein
MNSSPQRSTLTRVQSRPCPPAEVGWHGRAPGLPGAEEFSEGAVKKLKQIEGIVELLYKMSEDQLAEIAIVAASKLERGAAIPSVEPVVLSLIPEVQNDNGVPTEAILALFHEHAPKLPRVKTFDKDRRAAVCARWRESKDRQTLAWWVKFFSFVNDKCPFLTGSNDRKWRASFDFLMKKANMRKVIENGYTARKAATA